MGIKLLELFDFSHGNTDELSYIEDTSDIRGGMFAFIPHSVGDYDIVNENVVSFIENRSNYPEKPINKITQLRDIYNECLGNFKNTINLSENKKTFIENFIKLGEYLNKYDTNVGCGVEIMEDFDKSTIPKVIKFTLLDKPDYARKLAKDTLKKLNLNTNFTEFKPGSHGYAYKISEDVIFKLTADKSEAHAASKLIRLDSKYIAKVYDLFKIYDTEKNIAVFGILQENISDKPIAEFNKYNRIINTIQPMGLTLSDIYISMKKINTYDPNLGNEFCKRILIDNLDLNISKKDREDAYKYFQGILNIRDELASIGIKSTDFSSPENLGYSDGVLKFFDVGGYFGVDEPPIEDSSIILLPENDQLIYEAYDRETADTIANILANKLNINKPTYMGAGGMGVAYDIGNDRVLKITSDRAEAMMNLKLKGVDLKYIAIPYNVYSVKSKIPNSIPETYAIILEKLETDLFEFERLMERLVYVFRTIFKIDIVDVFEYFVYGNQKGRVPDTKQLINYMMKNKEDGWFFQSLLRIGKELVNNGVSSLDFLQPRNLGFKKNGVLGFFDVGMSDFKYDKEPETIEIDEDGTALYSTSDGVGRDDFPSYNQNDTSPMVSNDVGANSSIYFEDLEYSKVGDATKDEFVIDEDRKKAWMDGSQSVEVKKKCKLGGLGNTSVACNQGDISNLIYKNLNESGLVNIF